MIKAVCATNVLVKDNPVYELIYCLFANVILCVHFLLRK